MESSGEPYHVESEGLGPVIGSIPKSDGHIDLPEWYGLFARHDAMKRRSDGAEVRPVDTHLVERSGVHNVEAAAPVHQYFRESLWANDRVNDKWVPSWVWDGIRMVGSVEGYGGFRPPEEGRHGRSGCIDFAARDLLAALRVIGR